MQVLKLENTLQNIQGRMRHIAPHRHADLFGKFLVKGYSAITLSTLPEECIEKLLLAKLCLGSLITLYDDFADKPDQANPRLLEFLYELNFESYKTLNLGLSSEDREVVLFAQSLFVQIDEVIEKLPHYNRLIKVLNFDLSLFYAANRYSTLLTSDPVLHSSFENRIHAHHNMGMVMASSMDLMTLSDLNFEELGHIREVFLIGQRMGRIFNVLTTYNRECSEKDVTGELSQNLSPQELNRAKSRMLAELKYLKIQITQRESHITSFSVTKYLAGLDEVQRLHQSMEGIL